MADTNLTAGQHGAYDKTLTAATVETVTFDEDLDQVEIASDGRSAIYVTVDGTTPAVGGAGTYKIPAINGAAASTRAVSRIIEVPTSGDTVVKLIAAAAVGYDVARPSTKAG